ncbi:hypothetical protein J5N97_026628 [Dioscorea zingiberensis]|uniref:PGG domain-containing protein n=1 Tax=Dioscorea zingiberensis TaxID=325984 RepID=A0A9D5H6Y6_9LILI|nr:hypothetical protein J5N97_026628 [Dioscorea zingiberensis]
MEMEMKPHRRHMGASLLLAARSGDLETLESLLSPDHNQINIDVDVQTPHKPNLSPVPHETETIFGVTAGGNTLLHIAAQYGQPRIAEEVCRRECSLISAVNTRLDSSLHLCAKSGHLKVSEVIINYMKKGGFEDVLRVKNMNGDTALHEAVRAGHVHMVKKFISVDAASASIVNNAGMSPLYLAVMRNSLAMVEALLQPSSSYAGPGGQTALHAAVARCPEITAMLLKWKPRLGRVSDDSANTPLHYVAASGDARIARFLLEHDASTNFIPDKNGLFPIHIASCMDNVQVIIELLKHCPDSDELVDGKGRSFLHVAVVNHSQRVFRYVLERPNLEKLLNDQDYEGNTPLHLAVTVGGKEIVYDLIRNDRLDSGVMNNEGLTPLDLSQKLNNHMGCPLNAASLILRCLVDSGAIFSPKRFDLHKRNSTLDLESEKLYISSSQSLAILSMLIATVTFAAGFTVPGGYWSNNDSLRVGTAILSNKYCFKVFLISDTLAMVCSLIVTYWSTYLGGHMVDLNTRKRYWFLSFTVFWVAFVSMNVAFGMALMAILSPQSWQIGTIVCTITFVAPLAILLTGFWQVIKLSRITGFMKGLMKTRQDPQTKMQLCENWWQNINWLMLCAACRVLFAYVIIFGLAMF